MTQLIITLKDQSYLPNIRRIVKSLQGVERVSTSRKPASVAGKRTLSSTSIRKRQNVVHNSELLDPLEALDSIGQLVRSTGKPSKQLIDEYLVEKYAL